ncbi:MAG TPA: aminopeptidase [Nevskiaceae bacterium]|nr:aminopeptidase [Nevskiaceae bacterium]
MAGASAQAGSGDGLSASALIRNWPPTARQSLKAVLGAVLLAALGGCSTVGYYWQAAHGEYALLSAREPISRLVAAPTTAPRLKARLEVALQARHFASEHLDLPRNSSYTSYADVHRPFVVWNVYATPQFSVVPVSHCFPIAGCVAYQGYFSKAGAEAAAARWRVRGDDTAVDGVPTFSTLGWFDDPVISTMLRWNNANLVGEIFHELAHQKIYVKGDTQFNESYANFVEREGLRQWRATRKLPPMDGVATKRADEFTQLMLATRKRLAKLYAHKLPADVMRARKADVFADLDRRYRKLRDGAWHGYAGYDAFFRQPMNNARLVPFGLYDKWVPGFRKLFEAHGREWPRFFAAVRQLKHETARQRDAEMRRLTLDATHRTGPVA